MDISSRTPEGLPNRCPICGNELRIEPSEPLNDAPCPHCGQLLWFVRSEAGAPFVGRQASRISDSDGVASESALASPIDLLHEFCEDAKRFMAECEGDD